MPNDEKQREALETKVKVRQSQKPHRRATVPKARRGTGARRLTQNPWRPCDWWGERPREPGVCIQTNVASDKSVYPAKLLGWQLSWCQDRFGWQSRLARTLAPPPALKFPPAAKLFPAPNQIKHPPLERPVFNPLNQTFAKRIFLNISPLLAVTFTIAQPMMPAARLKFPFGWWSECPHEPLMLEAEFSLPIFNPSLDGEIQISRRTEQMQVIRHQQIIAHQPRRRL